MSGVPMNMDEWNLRMRAQKEQERKKKTESAEILRGYRGGVKEEDMKLTAIRQEERRKQEEAERILRGYRETHVEERERRPRKDQDYPYPPVVAKQDDDVEFLEGSVAARAAQFDSPQRDPSAPSRHLNADKVQLELRSPPIAEKDDSDYEFVHHATSEAPGSDSSPTDLNVADATESNMVDDPVPQMGLDEDDDAQDEEEKKVVDPDPELVSPSEPPLLHHPTVVRLDVNFSFGLITVATKPLLDSYMLAVDEVVRNTLESNAHLAHHITYNPKFGPFVQDCSDDVSFVDPEGRANVRRVLVTAAVPVFLGNGVSIGRAREVVIAGLQGAIHSGRFLDLALGNGNGCTTEALT